MTGYDRWSTLFSVEWRAVYNFSSTCHVTGCLWSISNCSQWNEKAMLCYCVRLNCVCVCVCVCCVCVLCVCVCVCVCWLQCFASWKSDNWINIVVITNSAIYSCLQWPCKMEKKILKWYTQWTMVATPQYSGEVTKVVWPPLFSKYTTSRLLLSILQGHCCAGWLREPKLSSSHCIVAICVN
jgi:hypothetical protein